MRRFGGKHPYNIDQRLSNKGHTENGLKDYGYDIGQGAQVLKD